MRLGCWREGRGTAGLPLPTSFLARLASHICLSTSSWSFRACSSIWGRQQREARWLLPAWASPVPRTQARAGAPGGCPGAGPGGAPDTVPPSPAWAPPWAGTVADLVPALLLLSPFLKLGPQGAAARRAAVLQLLPQLLQLPPLPAGPAEVSAWGWGWRGGRAWAAPPRRHLAACWSSRSFSSATSRWSRCRSCCRARCSCSSCCSKLQMARRLGRGGAATAPGIPCPSNPAAPTAEAALVASVQGPQLGPMSCPRLLCPSTIFSVLPEGGALG